MILFLCLLLPALSPSSQEICSAPGTLRAPTLYLSLMSARQGDSLLLQCSVFSQAPATRVIFCKDGEEVLFQMGSEEKITYVYNHTVSSDSSGNYACGYEIKDKNNRVIKSQLSPVKHLSVTCESGLDLKLLLGITIPAVLVLAVVLYLLGKKGNVSTPLITLSNCLSAMSLPRNQRSVHEVAVAFSRLLGRARQQGRPERVQRDTSNPYEEDIHYASVDWLGSSRQPLPQREETLIYADINLQRGRCH
ncbi:uncharacterized protein LOC120395108 isoform X3 [Mauremys reevesii]|uniref:uncharacterized protein LOC120395108 isoform X3 n=1 Tax=Mauremys reevesii TaxID=260615 RepID=UPI00193F280D|nr:uncharacterized protein LOC120395108 isoform X3 [Mauremys reevesii]